MYTIHKKNLLSIWSYKNERQCKMTTIIIKGCSMGSDKVDAFVISTFCLNHWLFICSQWFKYSSAYTVLSVSVSWNKLYLKFYNMGKTLILQSVTFNQELLQNICISKNVKIISIFLCKKKRKRRRSCNDYSEINSGSSRIWS